MTLIDSLFRSRKTEFTVGPIGQTGTVVPKESAYLSVVLLSCRIIDVRKGLSRFFGTVHSAIDIDVRRAAQPRATVTTVTTPTMLKGIEASSLSNVITLKQRLLGPVPYRGGDVHIEAGLFSVKEADLAGPFLEVLGDLSSIAGTSILGAALPLAPSLIKGFDLLAGSPSAAGLEIGISDTWTAGNVRTGTFAVMRAPAGSVSLAQLGLDEAGRLMNADGSLVLGYPYFVIQVTAGPERDDFFSIPELASTYEAIQAAIRDGGKDAEARELLRMFRRLAMTSPDLLLTDGARLAKMIEHEVTAVIGSPGQELARPSAGPALMPSIPRELTSLRNVRLYGAE